MFRRTPRFRADLGRLACLMPACRGDAGTGCGCAPNVASPQPSRQLYSIWSYS